MDINVGMTVVKKGQKQGCNDQKCIYINRQSIFFRKRKDRNKIISVNKAHKSSDKYHVGW